MRKLVSRLARRAFHVVREGYYAWFHGRDLPFAARLGALVQRGEARLRMQDAQWEREQWERGYRSGGCGFLEDVDERVRQSVICRYLTQLKPGGNVLDVGCGMGVLHRLCQAHDFASYTGIDISHEVISQLRQRQARRSHFLQADVNTFGSDSRFDAIVFNESIYYLNDPVEGLRRYDDFLAPGGIFVITRWLGSPRGRHFFRRIRTAFEIVYESDVRCGHKRWEIIVARPAPATTTIAQAALLADVRTSHPAGLNLAVVAASVVQVLPI